MRRKGRSTSFIGLERCRGVGEPKRHDQELQVAVVCAERRLGHIVRVHPHLVVAQAEVELGEVPGPMELVQELDNQGNRELVLGCQGVEGPVVDAKAPRRVWLAHQQHRGRKRRCALPNDPLRQHSGTLPLKLVLLQLRVVVWSYRHWC